MIAPLPPPHIQHIGMRRYLNIMHESKARDKYTLYPMSAVLPRSIDNENLADLFYVNPHKGFCVVRDS